MDKPNTCNVYVKGVDYDRRELGCTKDSAIFGSLGTLDLGLLDWASTFF
jgi:hypothetical protein